MNIQIELLKQRDLNPLQKLVLGLILDTPPIVLQYAGGCDKNCGEIGEELGESRDVIRREVDHLIELDLITSEWGDGRRISNVTQRLRKLLTGA